MLQFVDANVRLGAAAEATSEELSAGLTPLHHLIIQLDPEDHSFHKNQVILGQQLFRHGANADLNAFSHGTTPLHIACDSSTVTNLDFIQLLWKRVPIQMYRILTE
jgi:ankyrin repeat protein